MFCTCKNLDCPLHPSNHDKGCSPCISKNLKLREMPECFFQKLEHAEDRGGKRVRQVRRDQRHDFYDVWIFRGCAVGRTDASGHRGDSGDVGGSGAVGRAVSERRTASVD